MAATVNPVESTPDFLHEAFFYDGDDDYLARTVPFIEEGLDLGQPVLVAVPWAKLALIQARFERTAAEHLCFAAMEEIGRNPSWIIPAWSQFVAPHTAAGRSARGIGEPIWASRTPEELIECERHEALINVAFSEVRGFELLCPYDLSSLGETVIEEAYRNHPEVSYAGRSSRSERYRAEIPALLDSPLPPVPGSALVFDFHEASCRTIRRAASAVAADAGVSSDRIADLLVAVSEAVANSVRHGGGSGRISLWREGRRFLAQVRDSGRITDPLAGRVRPSMEQVGGRGLWMMNQLCDLVQIRALPDGQVVRLHMAGE
jgi:anti-sigma regulatory factor (Ser/Thr protein kinase)